MPFQNTKLTLDTIIKCILVRTFVPTDDEILAEVHMVRPDCQLNVRGLRWYKHRFRTGALPGMDGRCHAYNQPAVKVPRHTQQSIKRPRRKRSMCVFGCELCRPELQPGVADTEVMASW